MQCSLLRNNSSREVIEKRIFLPIESKHNFAKTRRLCALVCVGVWKTAEACEYELIQRINRCEAIQRFVFFAAAAASSHCSRPKRPSADTIIEIR